MPTLSLVLPRLAARMPRALGVFNALALHRQRQQLDRLDDHILRDIGITREDARREARRPPWDAPAHWHAGGRG